jgi:signal transduction histidine kinase
LQIAQRFDSLIELTADDSFLERRQSVLTVQQFEYLSIGATIAALLAAIGIAVYLTRRISHPLATAANVADRIGHGELQTPFPDMGADETGILLKSLKLMQDRIRVMMEREQAQRQSAQGRLIDAVESSHEAIALIDPDGHIALSNSQFSRILPVVTRLLAERREQSGCSEDAPLFKPSALLESELVRDGAELEIGERRWIRISRSSTREGGFFLSFTDISDLKEREDRYREAKVAAEAASVTKSRFLANMSHELRTPLNAIIGFSDLFAGEYFGPIGNAAYKEHAKEIQASGWRLLGIIENVLDLSNSQSGNLELKLESHDLRETVEEARRPLQKSCEEAGLTLTVDYGEVPLMILGDPEKLRRILDNLSSNAIKFNRPEGRVNVVARRNAGKIEMVVSDTGIGMPESDIPIAFSAFGQIDSTLNRRYDGTGLGLALASAYTEAHGGSISLVSEVGSGTTVTVAFVEHAEAVVAMPLVDSAPPKPKHARPRRVPVGSV